MPVESGGKWRWLLLSAPLLAAVAVSVLVWQDAARGNPSPPANRPIAAQQQGYVTSDSCRACHPANYTSWHTSFHRTMTQVASAQTLVAQANGVELSFAGREWKLTREGDRILAASRSSGAAAYDPPREVVLLTGSHTLQILWIETGAGRTLEQFPFAYIIAEKMWAPVTQTVGSPGTELEFAL